MSSTREGRTNSRREKWVAIAAKGKTRWVFVRFVLGWGLTTSAITFLLHYVRDHAISGFREILLDLLIRVPFFMLGGYLAGLLTWKWFSFRYGVADDLKH